MSTIKVRNVESPDGGLPNNLLPVTASAWVSFNGTGVVAIRDSYNVSSITDAGVGTYVANITTPLSTSDYSVVAGSSLGGEVIDDTSFTTSSVRIVTITTTTGAPTDAALASIQILGGQS